jgi:hypothetical protein
MRCTRCDRIAVPQAVGLTREGLVVFGWCLTCLAEEGCVLVEIPGDGPFALRGSRRRGRRTPRWRGSWRGLPARPRRLALVMVATFMAGWAALLTAFGAMLLAFPLLPARRLSPPTLLGGGGLMAATSLSLWLAALDRRRVPLVLLKVVQVTAAVVAFGVLICGIARPDPWRNVAVLSVALPAFAVSWAAHWAERRLRRIRALPQTILREL